MPEDVWGPSAVPYNEEYPRRNAAKKEKVVQPFETMLRLDLM